MENELKSTTEKNVVIHYALQLLALGLLLVWCFWIVQPFITPLVWGAVLAITLYPLHVRLSKLLRGRKGLAAAIISILMLLLIMGPAIWLLLASVSEFKELGTAYRAGELTIPAPAEGVKSWPLIGTKLYGYWTQAATDLTKLVTENQEEVKAVLINLLDLMTSAGKGILLFTISIIISGVLLTFAKSAGSFGHSLLIRIAGKQGETMAKSIELTVRNVAKSILGVSLIQSLLAGIGFVTAGIPFAGLWTLVCLILAIIQVGLAPVSIGVIIYIWSTADTLTAILLTIWMVLVGIMDNILKPIMLGKGAPAPMAVVFIGSIGGFMVSGIIGLFTGAIILTLGYKLVIGWVNPEDSNPLSKKAFESNA